MVIGAVMIPVSLVVIFFEQVIGLEWLVDLTNTTVLEPASELIGMTIGAFIGASVVSVAVFAALRDFDEGNRPSVAAALRRVVDRGPVTHRRSRCSIHGRYQRARH